MHKKKKKYGRRFTDEDKEYFVLRVYSDFYLMTKNKKSWETKKLMHLCRKMGTPARDYHTTSRYFKDNNWK